jgi:hypothetical protein
MSDIEQGKDLMEVKRQEIAQMDELATDIVSAANEAVEKADEMYQYMSDLIEIDADKSDATRQMMGKALEIRIMSNAQKLELLKIKAKLLNPGRAGTNVNINLGEYDDKKGADTNSMIDIVEGIRRGNGARIVTSDDFSDE